MKRIALLALVAVFAGAPALAQQAPAPLAPAPAGPGDGPPPQMQAARDAARSQAMAALSSDHQAKVNAILTRVKAGQLTDAHDAAQAMDAVLTPKESQAVLAARDRMIADLRAADERSTGTGGDGGPPPGGNGAPPPGDGAGPGGGFGRGGGFGGGGFGGGGFGGGGGRHRGGGHAMRNDAGFALLTLNLDRDQMRALFADPRPPQ